MFKHIAVAIFFVAAIAQNTQARSAGCPSDLYKNPPPQRASVFLRTDKGSYSLAGSLAIDAGIMNSGADPIYVYGWISWGYGGGLVIRLRNDHGKEIAPVLRDDTMLPPENDDSSMFVKLREGGDFFGTHREIAVKDLVKRPGKYTLQIEYRSPLSCNFVGSNLQKLPALWHEDASIFSKQVPFEVTP